MSTVHEVRRRHESELLAIPGVVGVADAETGGQSVITVFVADETAGSRNDIPSQLEGFPVEIVATGEIGAQ